MHDGTARKLPTSRGDEPLDINSEKKKRNRNNYNEIQITEKSGKNENIQKQQPGEKVGKKREGNNELEEAYGEVSVVRFGYTDGKHAILGKKQDK